MFKLVIFFDRGWHSLGFTFISKRYVFLSDGCVKNLPMATCQHHHCYLSVYNFLVINLRKSFKYTTLLNLNWSSFGNAETSCGIHGKAEGTCSEVLNSIGFILSLSNSCLSCLYREMVRISGYLYFSNVVVYYKILQEYELRMYPL